MYERFTDDARKAMQLANQEAQKLNHSAIGTEHLILALTKFKGAIPDDVCRTIANRTIYEETMNLIVPSQETVPIGKLPQTPRAKRIVEYAMEEARNLNHNYIGSEHLFLGLLREPYSVAYTVLKGLGVDPDETLLKLRIELARKD